MQEMRVLAWPWVGKIPLEEEMAIHSSILVWEIPWTEELAGGLQLMGVAESETNLAIKKQQQMQVHSWVGKTPWRRKWQSTPAYLPG